MTMSKQDFQAIADAVAEAKRSVLWYGDPRTEHIRLEALNTVTKELATACARQYKGGYGFNRQKFVQACGFGEE